MTSQRTSTGTMMDSARFVLTAIIREPVKEAVREALREEAASVRSASDAAERASGERETGQSEDQGGRSWLTWVGVLVAVAGVTYLARRRMSSTSGSTWSEPSAGAVASDDAEGGYVSEGEMQTAETAGESESESGGSDSSQSAGSQ